MYVKASGESGRSLSCPANCELRTPLRLRMLTQWESPDHVPFNLIRHDALSLSGDSAGAGAGAVVAGPVVAGAGADRQVVGVSEHWLLGPHFPVRHCMISFLQSNERPALTIRLSYGVKKEPNSCI